MAPRTRLFLCNDRKLQESTSEGKQRVQAPVAVTLYKQDERYKEFQRKNETGNLANKSGRTKAF